MVPSGTRTVLREAAVSGRANGVYKTLKRMSVRKGRGAKVPPGQVHNSQMESTSLSVVDQASFLEGLERNDSNPLHSTALEEHLHVQEEGQLDKNRGQRGKIAPVEKQGAAAKRKGSRRGEEEERKKKSRTDTGGKGRARQLKGAAERQPDETAERSKMTQSKTTRSTATTSRRLSGKKPVGMRKTPGRTAAIRPAQRQQLEEEGETASESADEKTSESEEESDSDGARRNRRIPPHPSSDEEDNEGSVWNPSPMMTKRHRLGRKSSSDKTEDAKADGGVGRKKRAGRGGSQLEVVLDAVLDFCQQYGETVESATVRESVACFANNVEAQLEEQISSLKDLRSLKRENIKVGSLIRKKTQRLLNAKHKLMRAERQLLLLEKEKAELQQRLDDLRRGRAFLHNVRELTARYLAHRRKRPAEKETFGASSLPALLLETKFIQRPVQAKKIIKYKK